MKSRYFLVLLASLIAGCSEDPPFEPTPDGVCSTPGACEVAGVDLLVTLPDLTGIPLDNVTGLPLIFPEDTIDVRSEVRNRGDETSAATALVICVMCGYTPDSTVTIQPLMPGAVDSGTVRFPMPDVYHSDTVSVQATLDWQTSQEDPLYLNDTAAMQVYFAVPMPVVTVEVPGGEIRTAESKLVRVRIENASRLTAISNRTLYFCLADFDIAYCDIDERNLRDIPPGGVLDTTVSLTVPHDAWEAGLTEAVQTDIVACVRGPRFWWCGDEVGRTRLLPNLDDFCNAPVISASAKVSGETDNSDCRLDDIGRSDVWSIEVTAGTTVTAQLTSTTVEQPAVRIISWRGDAMSDGTTTATFTAGNDTRYHIIVTGAGEYTLQLSSPD